MDDYKLTKFFESLFHQYFPSDSKIKISAHFKSKKSLNHSIEKKRKQLYLKISSAFKDAPEEILETLGLILFSKIFRIKLDTGIRKRYNTYVNNFIAPHIERQVQKPSPRYSAIGEHYNLNSIFDELNARYFDVSLPKPLLGWSLNNSYVRLGFYSAEKNLLVISRIFDNRKAPADIVCYLMYHEMLHIKFPVQNRNGRRIIHSLEFREHEKLFPGYDSIQKWLKRKRFKLFHRSACGIIYL